MDEIIIKFGTPVESVEYKDTKVYIYEDKIIILTSDMDSAIHALRHAKKSSEGMFYDNSGFQECNENGCSITHYLDNDNIKEIQKEDKTY